MAEKLLKTLDFGTGDTYHLAPEWDNIQNKPENIGGGGGKADSVEWDDVKNKPFGYGEEKLLLDNEPLVPQGGMTECIIPDHTMTIGSLYKVTLGGNVYEVYAESNTIFGIVAGDTGILMGQPNGAYPFALISDGGDTIMCTAEAMECNVTLTEREISKIPSMYYETKKTLYRGTDDAYLCHDPFLEKKVTKEEFSEIYLAYPVYVSLGFPLDIPQYMKPVLSVGEVGANDEAYVVYTYSLMSAEPNEYEAAYTAEYTG